MLLLSGARGGGWLASPPNVILTKVRTQFQTQREMNWRHILARCSTVTRALTLVRVTIIVGRR